MKQSKIILSTDEEKTVILKESGEYVFELTGPGAELEVKGTFLAKDKENQEIIVIIRHLAPHTRANTVLKGVAQDKGQLRFVGRIIIDKNCGDTQSFLEERVLLLSDEAKAETVPDLEIESDDVKCSHAASISRIPDEQLFYLQSRGVSRSQAEKMIVEGFLKV